jgi:hypothetical protein
MTGGALIAVFGAAFILAIILARWVLGIYMLLAELRKVNDFLRDIRRMIAEVQE